MVIEFAKELTAKSSVYIEDVGNTFISAYNELDDIHYYFFIKTVMGTSYVITWGGDDSNFELEDNFYFNYSKIQYAEKKIIKLLSSWLNDKSKKLSSAEEVKEEEYPSFLNYLKSDVDNIKIFAEQLMSVNKEENN